MRNDATFCIKGCGYGGLGIFAPNQYDESKNDRKDQEDVDKPAHRVSREHS